MACSRSMVLYLMLAVLGSIDGGGAMELNMDEKDDILVWHNLQRSVVSPPATNMLELVWNEQLASIAQTYSETCPQNNTRNPQLQSTPDLSDFTPVGENILTVDASELERNGGFSELLQMHWVDSMQLGGLECTGDYCTEYLQVVWAESQFIGCGASVCGRENRTLIVCDYGPGLSEADILNMTAPYKTGGDSCSECPSHAPDCKDETLCYDAQLENSSFTVPAQTTTINLTPSNTLTILSTTSSFKVATTLTRPIEEPPSATHTAQSLTPSPVLQTVTVTVSQIPSNYCLCSEGSGTDICLGFDRLANSYVIIIGVIPSTVAIALLCLLLIVVCANRKRNRGTKTHVYQVQSPEPRSNRRNQVRDSGAATTPNALSSVQLRHHVSPIHSLSASTSGAGEPDIPLLPQPPTPNFDFAENYPPRESSFRVIVPNATYHDEESTTSNFSEPMPAHREGGYSEDSIRQPMPMIGLQAINEEWEEGSEGVEPRGGVASIIARLERGKGHVITTEC